jgi:methylated-DNA-[protein]-cysteine S-methyltransferase
MTLFAPLGDEVPFSLRHRLAVAADAAGVLDLAFRTVDSPIGGLLLAATDRGLVRVAFEVEGLDAVLRTLAVRIGPRVVQDPPSPVDVPEGLQRNTPRGALLDEAARELDEYFAGRRTVFELPLDLRLATGFRQTVMRHMIGIGYGRTASYAQLALASGTPKAVRAVGSACATNPLPVIVPCHRVVRSDGSLGNYLAGVATKRRLLDLEAAAS